MARYGGVGGPKNLATPNLRRSKSHVVKKLGDSINTDEKQRRLKTSTSCPNVGNQTKKPMARKPTLKLKPKSKSELNQQIYKVSSYVHTFISNHITQKCFILLKSNLE